jgi:serine/threonine-protein kinase
MHPFDPLELVGCLVDGRYRLEALAGHGGFGSVYRAHHVRFRGSVAVKILRVPSAFDINQRENLISSFEEEGRLLFELSSLHPAIVQVKESGVLLHAGASLPYLVLEWLDGISLETEIRSREGAGRGPRDLGEAMRILEPIAEALAVTHSRGIAHRDIKPGNVFLSRVGPNLVPKLLDFGIAKALGPLGSTTAMYAPTSEGRSAFTELYGAPEQWFVRLGATGPWTDVYAFALVLVEMLSGTPPLAGQTAKQLAGAALDPEVRPTPRTVGVDVPDSVERVFRDALSVDPRERPRSMAVFWHELRDAVGGAHPQPTAVLLYDSLVVSPEGPSAALASCSAGGRNPTGATEPGSLPPPPSASSRVSHPPVSGESIKRGNESVDANRRRIPTRWAIPTAVSAVLLGSGAFGLAQMSTRTGQPARGAEVTISASTSSLPILHDALVLGTSMASNVASATVPAPVQPVPSAPSVQDQAPKHVPPGRTIRRVPTAPAASTAPAVPTSLERTSGLDSDPNSPHEALSSWR